MLTLSCSPPHPKILSSPSVTGERSPYQTCLLSRNKLEICAGPSLCLCRYPTNKWQKLGTFHARDERTVQSFPLDEHLYAKYVKVSTAGLHSPLFYIEHVSVWCETSAEASLNAALVSHCHPGSGFGPLALCSSQYIELGVFDSKQRTAMLYVYITLILFLFFLSLFCFRCSPST